MTKTAKIKHIAELQERGFGFDGLPSSIEVLDALITEYCIDLGIDANSRSVKVECKTLEFSFYASKLEQAIDMAIEHIIKATE